MSEYYYLTACIITAIVIIISLIIILWYRKRKIIIYIAFSYEDKAIKDKLVKALEGDVSIKKKCKIRLWNDDWILKGCDFAKKNKKEVKKATFAIIIVNDNYPSEEPSDAHEDVVEIKEKRGRIKVLIVTDKNERFESVKRYLGSSTEQELESVMMKSTEKPVEVVKKFLL